MKPVATLSITDREFALVQALIYRESGIHLSEAKRALLVRRLSGRLRELGLGSFSAYYRRVKDRGGARERTRMLDRITTNETHFFREPRQFEFLEHQLVPEWKRAAAAGERARRIRVWSSACSTGEEPFSVAMVLLRHLPPGSGWSLEVLATDLSTRVLESARRAIWPIEKVREIPEVYLRSFMLRGKRSQLGWIKAAPRLRSVVSFQHLNLHDSSYSVAGPFDLILCRNVLIYFDSRSKSAVLDRLIGQLAPAGHLFMGHAESLAGMTHELRTEIPTVYRVGRWQGERALPESREYVRSAQKGNRPIVMSTKWRV